MLYTLPLNADQASARLLCSFNTDGGIRISVSTPYHWPCQRTRLAVYIALTRKSSPDDFNRAQSNGLCPGARATLFLFFDGLTGAVVVDGGSANDETPG